MSRKESSNQVVDRTKLSSETLHIVTGSDDNFAIGVAGLVASLGKTNPGARISILSLEISAVNRARIVEIGAISGVGVEIIEVDRNTVEHLIVRRAHITNATFLRLLIPELFPQSKRILYLDCDMIVLRSLEPIWSADLSSNLIGAVTEPSAFDECKTASPRWEVNAGLLLMNLDLWRNEKIAETCIARIADPASEYGFEDQSAINEVCRGRVLRLGVEYNVFANYALHQPLLPEHPDKVAILHFVGDIKPWERRGVFAPAWAAAVQHISDLLPAPPQLPSRRRFSRWNLRRREILRFIMRRPEGIRQFTFERAIRHSCLPVWTVALTEQTHT